MINFFRLFKLDNIFWGLIFIDFYWRLGMKNKGDECLNSVLIYFIVVY